VRNSAVAQGQFLSDVDVQQQVSALGAETARTLFGNRDPIGGRNRIENQDEAVFVPLQQWLTSYGRTSRRSPTVQTISVSARDQVPAPVSDYKPATPATQDWAKISPFAVSRTCYDGAGILILMLATTASISLLVGGIGINIMLVSVTEHSGNWLSDWRNEHRCAGPIHH